MSLYYRLSLKMNSPPLADWVKWGKGFYKFLDEKSE